MKTKRIALIVLMATILTNVQVIANNVKEDNTSKRLKRTELLNKRCQRMESQLALDENTAAKFTPLYKEYLSSLRSCHSGNCKIEKKGQPSDADRLARMEKNFESRQKMLDTQKKYFNEFKKILNARQLETLFCSHRKEISRRNYNKNNRHQTNCHSRSAQKRQADCRR